ncbi:MAG TPA: twin-arginine translocase TatA/TatE family subunit [Pirellulales bacterium]|nr:twin-arginine translocase TatA/TatE family subunit [Pirellulales bacterium]
MLPLAMIGPTEILIVGAVILLLFGNRLPSVMRSVGRSVVEFKKGVQGIEDDSEGTAPPVTQAKK